MPPIEVVYLYENVAREMDVACAVASLLRQRHGITVHIVQWPQSVPTLYGRVSPQVVVLPFCYFEHSFDCLLEWRTAAFVNLSWEQIFYRGNVKAKTPRGAFAISHVLHHAWSEVYAEFLREQSIAERHIFVNGHPAYGLYAEPYRRYFVGRAELASRHGLDPGKPWVFFPENYNWAFYSDEMLQFFLRAGQSPDDVQEMRDFCANSFRQVMQWFAAVARTNEVEVVIRPRPSTPASQFRAAVEAIVPDIPRAMHIIQDETVREWIMGSDVVLSSHSTSLIEASLAGRRAWMVTPFPVPAPLRQEWHNLVPHLTTEREFVAACLDGTDQTPDDRLANWARATFISRGDPIANLADYIARVATGRADRPAVPSRLCATAQGDRPDVPKGIWFLFRRLRSMYRRLVPFTPDFTRLREFVSVGDIQQRIERWEALLTRSTVEGSDRADAATPHGARR
jgi:surface carbohydrate biosynthesis protein